MAACRQGHGFLLLPSPPLERATKVQHRHCGAGSGVGGSQLEGDPVSCFGSSSSTEGIQWSTLQSVPHTQKGQELVFIKHLHIYSIASVYADTHGRHSMYSHTMKCLSQLCII